MLLFFNFSWVSICSSTGIFPLAYNFRSVKKLLSLLIPVTCMTPTTMVLSDSSQSSVLRLEFTSEIFPRTGKFLVLRKRTYYEHNNFFSLPWNFLFHFGVEKNSTSRRKKYSIVLSSNKIAECNQLKNKTLSNITVRNQIVSSNVLEEEL